MVMVYTVYYIRRSLCVGKGSFSTVYKSHCLIHKKQWLLPSV